MFFTHYACWLLTARKEDLLKKHSNKGYITYYQIINLFITLVNNEY